MRLLSMPEGSDAYGQGVHQFLHQFLTRMFSMQCIRVRQSKCLTILNVPKQQKFEKTKTKLKKCS
jgi:hypothetical protein